MIRVVPVTVSGGKICHIHVLWLKLFSLKTKYKHFINAHILSSTVHIFITQSKQNSYFTCLSFRIKLQKAFRSTENNLFLEINVGRS